MLDFTDLNRTTRETLAKAWSQSATQASANARRNPEAEAAPDRAKQLLATGKTDESPESEDEEVPEKGAGQRRGSVTGL